MATSSNVLARVRAAGAVRALAPIAVLAVVLAGVAAGNGAATAAPTQDIKQVEDQILALQQDAADAADLWNEAKANQTAIATKISALKVRIAAAELAYGKVSGAVDAMARAAYATGGIDPTLQALLADDPQSFLDQTAALDQVARSQGTSLRRTESARLLLAQLQAQLAQQKTAAAAAAADAAAQKQKIDDKLAAAEALLSSLKADERAKLAALVAARKAAGIRAAARAAAAAAAAQKAAQQKPTHSSHRGSSSSENPNPGGNGNGGAGRRQRVEPRPGRGRLRPVEGRPPLRRRCRRSGHLRLLRPHDGGLPLRRRLAPALLEGAVRRRPATSAAASCVRATCCSTSAAVPTTSRCTSAAA